MAVQPCMEWIPIKKKYAQNDATAPNLATNARVVFKLVLFCSMLINTLTYHALKTWYTYGYT